MAGKNQGVMLLATIVIASICGISSAATYTVGDNTGWTIPTSTSFYSNWASRQTFRVGDVLVFKFPVGAHTVAKVNRRNFDACNTATTIGPVQTSSPSNITLTTTGTHYFICTIPSHCSGNQKLSVTVTGSSAASPAKSPTPSRGAATPASSPTPSLGAATAPTSGAATPTESTTSPSGSPIVPTEGPSSTTASPPSFATSTNVGLLSLVSVVVAALMF